MTTVAAPPATKLTHFINGQWTDSRSGSSNNDWRDVVNPATGEILAQVPMADAAEVNVAVEAAAATSGRAVLISGITVIIAMAGMLFTGDKAFTGFGIAAMTVVAAAVIGSLTVLPALLARLGDEDVQIGGHAMTAVGYVDNEWLRGEGLPEAPGGGLFILRNSWGSDWARRNPVVPKLNASMQGTARLLISVQVVVRTTPIRCAPSPWD